MKFRFTAEHFRLLPLSYESDPKERQEIAAMLANAILEAEEAKCDRVHLSFVEMEGHDEFLASSVPQGSKTYTALLWNVSPLTKETTQLHNANQFMEENKGLMQDLALSEENEKLRSKNCSLRSEREKLNQTITYLRTKQLGYYDGTALGELKTQVNKVQKQLAEAREVLRLVSNTGCSPIKSSPDCSGRDEARAYLEKYPK